MPLWVSLPDFWRVWLRFCRSFVGCVFLLWEYWCLCLSFLFSTAIAFLALVCGACECVCAVVSAAVSHSLLCPALFAVCGAFSFQAQTLLASAEFLDPESETPKP